MVQHRPSKLTQTISRFKGIIRIPIRKAHGQDGPHATQKSNLRDGRGRAHQQAANHPYTRTSTTMRRESMKPYMSQPMLGLQRSSLDTDPYQHSHPDSDVSSSTSPDPSPSRLNSGFPLPTQSHLRLSRRLSVHSLSSQTPVIDGLPRPSVTMSEGAFARLRDCGCLFSCKRRPPHTSYAATQICTTQCSYFKLWSSEFPATTSSHRLHFRWCRVTQRRSVIGTVTLTNSCTTAKTSEATASSTLGSQSILFSLHGHGD